MSVIILCAPGKWNDLSEILTSLEHANQNEYLLVEGVLVHMPTNNVFKIEFDEFDSRMQTAFEVAGRGRLNEEHLKEIGEHTSVVYIIGNGGDLENADKLMKAGAAFLKAGGLGLKVETTGKAFTKDHWISLSDTDHEQKYYTAFAMLLQAEDGMIYTCGMHNLGLRDTTCDVKDVQQAADLMEAFNLYQLIEKPVIIHGQTFSPEEGAPVYKIFEHECTRYTSDQLFYNPFGMYYLQSI